MSGRVDGHRFSAGIDAGPLAPANALLRISTAAWSGLRPDILAGHTAGSSLDSWKLRILPTAADSGNATPAQRPPGS
jgi:hypothetical protein